MGMKIKNILIMFMKLVSFDLEKGHPKYIDYQDISKRIKRTALM
jgi:hypothetical protein